MAEKNAKFDYYNAIAAAYQAIQTRKETSIKKIDDALPSEPNLGKLIYFLHKKSGEDGMFIKSLSLKGGGTSKPGQSIKELGFSVNILGGYSSLNKFIKSLENSSRIFEVTSIAFNSANSNSSSPTPATGTKTQFQVEDIYSFNIEIKTNSY